MPRDLAIHRAPPSLFRRPLLHLLLLLLVRRLLFPAAALPFVGYRSRYARFFLPRAPRNLPRSPRSARVFRSRAKNRRRRGLSTGEIYRLPSSERSKDWYTPPVSLAFFLCPFLSIGEDRARSGRDLECEHRRYEELNNAPSSRKRLEA